MGRASAAGRATSHGQRRAQEIEGEAKLDGKVAVFPFRGGPSGAEAPVLRALRDRGFELVTDLRPVDLAEQFRELAVALNLVAFVEGRMDPRDEARVTLFVRSGYSGRRVAAGVVRLSADDEAPGARAAPERQVAKSSHAATAAEGAAQPAEFGERFWKRFGPALRRARSDADKSPRPTRAPMRIEAGSPLADRPAPPPLGSSPDPEGRARPSSSSSSSSTPPLSNRPAQPSPAAASSPASKIPG